MIEARLFPCGFDLGHDRTTGRSILDFIMTEPDGIGEPGRQLLLQAVSEVHPGVLVREDRTLYRVLAIAPPPADGCIWYSSGAGVYLLASVEQVLIPQRPPLARWRAWPIFRHTREEADTDELYARHDNVGLISGRLSPNYGCGIVPIGDWWKA